MDSSAQALSEEAPKRPDTVFGEQVRAGWRGGGFLVNYTLWLEEPREITSRA